ncbi:MAG TPA: hypothetical protein VIV60_18105 [Polyangiaceae bacterium]
MTMSCAILHRMHSQIPRVSRIALSYPQVEDLDNWWIPEGTVPQAVYHDMAAVHLQSVLNEYVERSGRSAFIARDLAIRFLEARPRIGIDPDLCVLDPIPPNVLDLTSLCLWKDSHLRPPLCVEIVSQSHPNKDYRSLHERYAWMHAAEVVIFDPMLSGPKALGGPVLLQLWRRNHEGVFERVAFGSEAAYCAYLDAWFIPRGRLLEIADDRAGESIWPTSTARERAAKEQERAAKLVAIAERDRELTLRLEMERRLAELEQRCR